MNSTLRPSTQWYMWTLGERLAARAVCPIPRNTTGNRLGTRLARHVTKQPSVQKYCPCLLHDILSERQQLRAQKDVCQSWLRPFPGLATSVRSIIHSVSPSFLHGVAQNQNNVTHFIMSFKERTCEKLCIPITLPCNSRAQDLLQEVCPWDSRHVLLRLC